MWSVSFIILIFIILIIDLVDSPISATTGIQREYYRAGRKGKGRARSIQHARTSQIRLLHHQMKIISATAKYPQQSSQCSISIFQRESI